jgi:WD40 repeat protein
MEIKHDAFISYNHGADHELAETLEAGMEKLAKPLFSLRAVDVFRDTTGLAANPNLWGEIVDHLGGAKWLVLLACPEWAGSHWCQQEALWWIENRSTDRILIALTGGELAWDGKSDDFDWAVTTALSKELSGRFREEPLYVDLRWARGRNDLTLRNVQFREAILNLSATIRGVRKDELGGEDVRQLRRTLNIAYSAAGVLAVLAITATAAGYGFWVKRDEALLETKIALGGKLAAESNTLRLQRSELLPHSLLKAIESMRQFPSLEADQAIRSGIALVSRQLKTLQHEGPVAALAVQPGGQLLATAGSNGNVVVWNFDAERQYTLPEKVLRHAPILFSPDGRLIATSDEDRSIHLRDSRTGEAVTDPLKSESTILRMAFNADGKQLAVLDFAGNINIWDTSAGTLVATLKVPRVDHNPSGHQGLAFSKDGHLAVVAYSDVLIWDKTWKEHVRLAQSVAVADLAFNLSSPFFLAVALQTGRILLFDSPASVPSQVLELGSENMPTKLAFGPDGERLAAGTAGGEARIWSAETWSLVATVHHESKILSLVFDPNGSRLATASADSTAAVWDAKTGEKLASMDHGDQVTHVAFSPNGEHVFTASDDGSARAWETVAGNAALIPGSGLKSVHFERQSYWTAAPGEASVTVWSASDRQPQAIPIGQDLYVLQAQERGQPALSLSGKIALADADDIVHVRDVGSERDIATLRHFAKVDWDEYQKRHGPSHDEMDRSRQQERASRFGTIWSASFSPGDRFLLTTRADSIARVWDLSTKQLTWEEPFERYISELAFSPNERFLALIKDRKALEAVDLGNRKKLLATQLDGEFQFVGFSGDAGLLIVGDDNRSQQGEFRVRAWRTSDWKELEYLTLGKNEREFVLSPRDDVLAAYGPYKNVRVLQLRTGKVLARIPTSSDVKEIVFAPDGTRIAIVTQRDVIVWDLGKNRELLSLAHSEEVNAAGFSDDGKYLATGGASLARIFTLGGAEIARLNHGKPVSQIRFIRDGKYIASADADGSRLWLWHPEDLLAEACGRLDRKILSHQWPLNPEESFAKRVDHACSALR